MGKVPTPTNNDLASLRPTNSNQIRAWCEAFLNFRIHSTIRCTSQDIEGGTPHQSQLDYVTGAFLNQYSSAVVIAARNGGKSYAAAIATFLDCWFKPGILVAVAAFKREQSDYIYRYLSDFISTFAKKIGQKVESIAHITKDEIEFANGSGARFFSGGKSAAGIKGCHPNVLIVDEADLFSSEQFDGIANALEAGGKFQSRFDILSTSYNADGVILKQVERYEQYNKTRNPHLLPCRVFRTCLIDLLEKCDDRFQCHDEKTGQVCPLWSYCRGRAKEGDGFYQIGRALETMTYSSKSYFQMLWTAATS
jgi:hypothetical protein